MSAYLVTIAGQVDHVDDDRAAAERYLDGWQCSFCRFGIGTRRCCRIEEVPAD